MKKVLVSLCVLSSSAVFGGGIEVENWDLENRATLNQLRQLAGCPSHNFWKVFGKVSSPNERLSEAEKAQRIEQVLSLYPEGKRLSVCADFRSCSPLGQKLYNKVAAARTSSRERQTPDQGSQIYPNRG